MSYSASIRGDNLEYMKELPDNFFDLLVADPPYFTGPEEREFYGQAISGKGVKRVNYPVTDTWEIPGSEYFKEAIRVSQHQIIWGCNYFDWNFGPGRIVWDKVNHGSTFSDCELAYCSIHDSTRLFRYMWNGMMQGKSIKEGHIVQGNKQLNERRIHPTQKPIKLYRWLFQTYAQPGWKIFDTHLGSGSSRIAAQELGFHFTGIELSPIHYANECNRYNEYFNPSQLKAQFHL